jgi:uncharacterized membrane protein
MKMHLDIFSSRIRKDTMCRGLLQSHPLKEHCKWSRIYNKSISVPDIGAKENVIQRGYIVLIIGGVLFVAGIIIAAVWAIPFASTFLQENTLINQVSIEPSDSVEATTQVTDVSRPITIAIHIERPEGVVRLIESVKDQSGTVVSSNEFSANLFTTFQPQNTGSHILNITNAGARPVTIDATFGYMPFMTTAVPSTSDDVGQPLPGVNLSSLSVIIAGGVLTAIGFFTIIAGIVIVVIDSRKRGGGGREQKGGSHVTEGGVTYRKD